MKRKTVTQQATKTNPEKPKPKCHHCKTPGFYQNHCRQLKKERDPTETKKINAGNNIFSNNNSGQTNSKPHNNKNASNGIAKKAINW